MEPPNRSAAVCGVTGHQPQRLACHTIHEPPLIHTLRGAAAGLRHSRGPDPVRGEGASVSRSLITHVLRFVVRGKLSPFAVICLTLVVLACAIHTSHAATNDLFARGIELSRAGQFPEAIAAFEKSEAVQPAAGTLVNLGLAEWQRGHAGAAILAWEQARWIDPYEPRAEANLKFAREVAQVDTPQLKWHESVSTWLPPNAWVWLAGATLWLAVGLLILPGVFRRRVAGWQQWLAALAFGFFLFSLAGNFGVVSRTQIGFVLKKNAPLRLTPTHDGEVISTLAAGEPARKLRTRGSYVFIRTLGGSGWLEQNEFGLLCPR